ncbi:hypothetical protein [Desulfonatronum parangueonense]
MNHHEQESAESRSEFEAIAALEKQIQDFAAQKQACAARVKELMFSEDTTAGIIHAKEIFMLQQDKLRLQVEMDCRRNKINRIRKFGLAAELSNTPPGSNS